MSNEKHRKKKLDSCTTLAAVFILFVPSVHFVCSHSQSISGAKTNGNEGFLLGPNHPGWRAEG